MRKHDQSSAAAEGARRATGAAAERDRKGRCSARRKRATVLCLLRGEDLESVSRELGITAARASQWRDRFLAAGQAGLKSRATEAGDDDHRRLQAKIGELLMETELLSAKGDQLEAGRPLARRRSTRGAAPSRSPPVGRMVCSASAACGPGRGRVSLRGGRHRETARAGIAAGPSVRPRTRSWWATSAGCLRRRRFMVRATGKSGRRCGSRGFGPRRSGCADECVRTTSRPRTAWARRMARRRTPARSPPRRLT